VLALVKESSSSARGTGRRALVAIVTLALRAIVAKNEATLHVVAIRNRAIYDEEKVATQLYALLLAKLRQNAAHRAR